MSSNSIDAGIGGLTIDAGIPSGGVASAQAADVAIPQLTIAGARKEIVFIEDDVSDIDTLVKGIGSGKQVVILDATQDGLHQIAQTLAGQSKVDAVHIISHGEAGAASLGSLLLDAGNLDAHKADLQTIGHSMSPGGDILLYGCDIGAGNGASFVQQLAIATGSDVAASNDLTGSAALGGDWNLEVASGNVETAPVVDAHTAALYQGVLNITPGTIGFSNMANFQSGLDPTGAALNAASTDVIYKVNGNAAYQLRVDGASTAVSAYSGFPGAIFAGANSLESSVTFSFVGGQQFTATSIAIANYSTSYQDQTLLIKGYDAGNHQVGTTVTRTLLGNGTWVASSIDLSALAGAPIASLKITATTEGGKIEYLMIDSISMSSVGTPAPAVTAVSTSIADGSYGAGTVIPITVTFDHAVTVGTTGGTPQLQLETGTTDHSAVYASGSGTGTLTFNYTVQAGDTSADLDYFNAAALFLNGGTIKSSGGANATLTLPAPGASGSLSVAHAIVIDTTAPTTVATSAALSSDTGSSATDLITSTAAQTISGTLSANLAAGEHVMVSVDNGASYTLSTASVGHNTWSLAGVTLSGSNTLKVQVIDDAGNVGPAYTHAYTIDTTAPATVATAAALSSDTGGSATDMVTSTAAQTISGTLSANLGAGEQVMVSLDNGATWNAATAAVGTNTWSLAATLGGSNTLKVQLVDQAGNAGPAYAHAYTIDSAAPAAPSTPDLATGSDSGSSHVDNITGVTTPTFIGTAEAGSTVHLYDGATEIGSIAANGSGNWSITSSALGGGNHTISATAVDLAGNVSNASSGLAIQVITAMPTTGVAGIALSNDSGASGSDFITNVAAQTLSGSLTNPLAADERVQVSLDHGGSWNDASATTGSAAWSFNASLAAGSHDIQVRVIDAVDNTGPVATQAYTLDTTGPTMAITSNASQLKIGETATITFTFSEDPGASFSWDGSAGSIAVSGGTLSAISGSGLTRTATFTPSANTDNGTASITVAHGAYTDAAGNAGAAGTTPSISYDTLAPAAPSVPLLATSSDSGVSHTDNLTHDTALLFNGTAEAGASVKLFDTDGTTQVGSGSADGGGVWHITTSTLSAGMHTVTAVASDAAGNASPASAGTMVSIDTTAPTLAITSDHSTLAIGQAATITFTFSEDPGASFSWDGSAGSIAVSGGTLSAISGSGLTRTATFTPAANTDNGTASITVAHGAYTDAAGNAGAAGATPSISYDTLAPTTPSAPSLAAGSDSGASPSDGVTNSATLSFSGGADTGATVRLYDGATEIGHATAAGGSYTIAVTGLTEGSHSISAVAFDPAGNASTASGATAVQVDRTAPATLVTAAALSSDTGGSATDMVTSTAAQTISGTLSANLAAGEQVMVSLDNGATWNAATAAVGTNAWSLAATLGGSNTLKVQLVDQAGNAGPAYAHAYTIDSAAPAAPSTPDLATGSDSGSSHVDNITGVTTPTFVGTAEAGSTVHLYDGATEIGSIAANGSGNWSITSSALGGGNHTISATAVDLAGNVSNASSGLAIQVITATPTTGVAGMALSNDSGASGSDFITNVAAQTLSGSLTNPLAADERVQVSLDHGGSWSDASATTGSAAWSFNASLAAGSHDIQVRVIDAVDNTGPVATQAYTLDTTGPTMAITSNASQLKIGETATITFTFSEDPGASFSWNGSAGDVGVSGGTLSAISGSGLTRTATFTPAANTDNGTASITVAHGAYTDAAGNAGAAGTTPSISYDTLAPTAPSVPLLASDNGLSGSDGITSGNAPIFSGNAEAGSTVTLYEAGTGAVLGSGAAASGSWAILSAPLTDGQHTVYAMARDAAGNVGAASAATTITIDTVHPTLALSSDLALLKAGQTATITFTFSEDPGTSFGLGAISASGGTVGNLAGSGLTRTVTFTPGDHLNGAVASISASGYSDQAGNSGNTSNTLHITVDTVAPDAPSTPALAAGSDSGGSTTDNLTNVATPTFTGTWNPDGSGSTVTLYDAGGSVLGSTTLSTSQHWSITSSALADGNHSVTAVVTDPAGNVGAASSALTIMVDTHVAAPAAPVLDPASDSGAAGDGLTGDSTPTVRGSAEPHASVTLYDSDGSTVLGSASADANGAWSITSSALADGSHALSVRQVDLAGNGSAASPVLVLNIDATAPVVMAAPVLAVASDSGMTGDGITNHATPTFSGTAEALAQVTLYDSNGTTVIGQTRADAAGAWHITTAQLADGDHALTARQADGAGNVSAASAVTILTVDTVAPPAPSAPALQASSDTGPLGDGITEKTSPVIEGTALANARVTLYDTAGTSQVQIGTATADGSGHWSIATAGLAFGGHALTAVQSDAASNVSAASAAFALYVDMPPAPVNLVDGVAVDVHTVLLPGGASGSEVSVPIVSSGRIETNGKADVADIPLVTGSQGENLLLAQLAAGYGLSASGANLAGASASELLLAAIRAATPTHTADDQGHLSANGQSFLSGLAGNSSLLVETVKPVGSAAAPGGTLTLSGPAAVPGQSTALVIDTAGLATGNTIKLQQVNFAAVIGAANVTAQGGNTVLSGDAANQHFTVAAGGSGSVFGGGGDDVLSFDTSSTTVAPAAGVTLLHGGADHDVAAFSGAESDYQLVFHNGYVVVSSKAAPDVKALVVNVEQLQFSDASVTIQDNGDLDTLAGMYRAVLGRQADLKGIEYWADTHQAGASWGAVALAMVDSAEHDAGHESFNGSAAHDLTLLYSALFNRVPDAAGLAYWTGVMGHGASLEQVANAMVQSVEMVGQQIAAPGWNFSV